MQQKGCNVAEGRNIAIRKASHDLIASTDFGCRFHPDWLKSLMSPFADISVKATGGAFSVIEQDIDTLPAKAAYILSNGYQVDIAHDSFIPSSRSVAYYKDIFERAGGYPEWLTLAGDDTTFGKVVKSAGVVFHQVTEPYVYWGRHKAAKAYVKEAFRYGLGDGEAHVNQRNVISNSIETLLRYLLFISFLILAIAVISKQLTLPWLLICIIFLPGLRSYINYLRNWLKLKSAKYNFSVFLYGISLLERTRLSYIKGYTKGYFKSSDKKKEEARQLQKRLSLK
ncbi:glycosyltransferase family protein [Niastella yeongjuensis]|uniref:glycosyltransferase n=1 Tax=Niastella yeongjuensis TaxID=354355 RepID=UPI001A9A1F5E|nr:glycosyltransferase [Niastella yeongjuensis]